MYVVSLALAPVKADGHVSGMIGYCSLSDSAWENVPPGIEHGAGIGIAVDFGVRDWPIHFAASFNHCEVDETEIGITSELGSGRVRVRRRLVSPRSAKSLAPYFGVGLSIVDADLETRQSDPMIQLDDGDSGSGFYVSGGFLHKFDNHWTIGIDLRLIEGSDVDLLSVSGSPGNFQAD